MSEVRHESKHSQRKLRHTHESEEASEIEPKWTRHGNLISRPKNCFLVYRLEMATPLTDTGLLKDNPSISKVVAEMWRREPESVKAYYPKKKKKSTNSSKSRLFWRFLIRVENFSFLPTYFIVL